jgi:RHS repeat-associated protein
MSGYTTGTGNETTAGGGYTFVYDNSGNLTGKTKVSNGDNWTYSWDYRNRLTGAVEHNSGGSVLMQGTYTYDSLNRRIGVDETVGGVNSKTWTVYDGQNPYADFNGSGTLQQRYLYGPAVDEILARTSSGGTSAWYLTDKLGSVHDLVNTSGTVIDHLAFDTYGNTLSESSPTNGDRFKFAAREYDSATGLYFNRARYYDPTTGRFISQDPMSFAAGDTDLYRYVGNGPTNATDPSGWSAIAMNSTGLADNGPTGVTIAPPGPINIRPIYRQPPPPSASERILNYSSGLVNEVVHPFYPSTIGSEIGQMLVWWPGGASDPNLTPAINQAREQAEIDRLIDPNSPPPDPDQTSTPTRAFSLARQQSARVTMWEMQQYWRDQQAGLDAMQRGMALAQLVRAAGGSALRAVQPRPPVEYRLLVVDRAAAEQAAGIAPANPASQAATNWRQHEQLVTQNLQNATPGRTIGTQVTLDVTNNATQQTARIRIDNLLPQGPGANPTYQLVDAKFSGVTDLTNANLTNRVTPNQAQVYPWISSGQNVTVVPVGQNAINAGLTPGVGINVNPSVQIHVNGPNGIVVRPY